MQHKKTYGQVMNDHWSKEHTAEDNVREYSREIGKDVIKDIYRVIEESKNIDLYKNKDFYIVLGSKIQKFGQAFEPLVWARRSCPTPVYSQCVWKYHHLSGALEFIFNIPDRFRYYDMVKNSSKYLKGSKDESEQCKTVLLMESGELLTWVKKQNGEKIDAIISFN